MQIVNKNLVKKLAKSGFSENEAKVYVALLELGGAYPSRIADYAGMKRTTAYNTLLKLSIQGIVNEIEKRNKQFYQPEKPQKVLRYVKGKERRAQESVEQIKTSLPVLEGLYGSSESRPKVTYHEGVEEVKEVFQQMYEADVIYGLADTKQLFEVMSDEFFTQWREQLRKKKIQLKDIVTASSVETPTETVEAELRDLFSRRVLPEKYKNIGTDILSWDDKVALISLGHPVTGTVIHNQDIALTFRIMHEIIWKTLQ